MKSIPRTPPWASHDIEGVFDGLTLRAPEMAYDLPAGGRRLIQRAEGYVATIKRGEVIYRDGVATGAMPGQLIRGPQNI